MHDIFEKIEREYSMAQALKHFELLNQNILVTVVFKWFFNSREALSEAKFQSAKFQSAKFQFLRHFLVSLVQ